jgi:hypothetical protein
VRVGIAVNGLNKPLTALKEGTCLYGRVKYRNCRRDIKTAKEQKMRYAKKTEHGDILLTPYEFVGKLGFSGLMFSHVTLSRMGCTIRWFMDFLTREEDTSADCESDDKKYHVCRESNAVYLNEIRGNHTNSVAFSSREIPEVLEELHQIMA